MPVVSIEGMRVMGIDPGLTRCGLSVVQAGRGRSVIPVAVGVVRTPSDSDIAHRLLELSEAVNDWLDQYQPDVVAIERIFERGNVSTVMNTAASTSTSTPPAKSKKPSVETAGRTRNK